MDIDILKATSPSDEYIFSANNLSDSNTQITLPFNIAGYKYAALLSCSIPKTYYNLPNDAIVSIDAVNYTVPRSIYNVYTLRNTINSFGVFGITYNSMTLKYDFNGHTVKTGDEFLAALLGVHLNLPYTASMHAISFQPYALLNIISNNVDNPNKVLAQVDASRIEYGGIVAYAPTSDKYIVGVRLNGSNTNTFNIDIVDSFRDEHINFNGLSFSVIIKLWR